MKYTTILMDADGTLLDFDACEYDAFRNCCRDFQIPWDEMLHAEYHKINDIYWERMEKGEITKQKLLTERFDTLFARHGFIVPGGGVRFEEVYRTHLAEGSALMEGAIHLMEEIHRRGARGYIVTNGILETQIRRFDDSGIAALADGVFISEEIGYEKPALEYFSAVFSTIPDFDPKRTVIIGDSLIADMVGGIRAGIDTCWMNPKKKPAGNIRPTYEVMSLKEAEEILLKE